MSTKQQSEQGVGFSFISRRLEGISESATLKLNATVQAMKAQGENIINLTAGEPDFSAPEAANEAVRQALLQKKSKYTPVGGIPELRAAVAEKTNRQQPSLASPWTASEVIVSNGGKQAIFNAIMALVDEGDEVLIPSPYWLSYPEMVKICGGVPKFISAPYSQNFKITPEQLKAALNPRVKVLFLNSPSNPTGAMYSEAELQALGRVLEDHPDGKRIWVISDEIYDRIILGEVPFCSFLQAAPFLKDRVITINGMSKSAAMTGWRIGWSVASAAVTQAISTLQGQSTSGICALSQWASLAALRLPEKDFSSQIETYRSRSKLMLENLRKARKIELTEPDGAFYLFIGVKAYLEPGEDSIGFAQRLLEEAKVAVIPGTPFGESEFVRLSFATDERSIEEGCSRIVSYLESR